MTTPARSAAAIFAGMTIRRAREKVSAVWPYVVLRLYHGTPAFYKEGLPWADDAYTRDDDVLRRGILAREPANDTVLLTGALTEKERRDRIYTLFELEPVWEYSFEGLNRLSYRSQRDTLDEMQIYAEQMCDAYKARFRRPAGREDRFDGVSVPPG